MLNELMQGECRTMIDFADKVRAFKEMLELWYVKVKNKKFASLPILNRAIADLDPESDLKTLISFVLLGNFKSLRKNFEKTFQKTSTTVRG